jgi:hypothetical protein
MAYTKSAAHYDQILLDGVDVSNAFNEFGRTGENETLDATGFSATGNAETVPGPTTAGFTGQVLYGPQIEAILWPLFEDKTIVEVAWQPDGLVTLATPFQTHVGNCYLNQLDVTDTKGGVRTATVRFDPADATGINLTTST